jgi:uncharacterized repeat protein (TIGR03803 family)
MPLQHLKQTIKTILFIIVIATLALIIRKAFVNAANVSLEFDTTHPYEQNYGYEPYYGVTYYNGKLYGVSNGGENGVGVIFSYDVSTKQIDSIYDFLKGTASGTYPVDSLTPYNGKLYGVAQQGGTSNYGIVYSINTDGTNFTILHSFADGATDGRNPQGKILIYNNKIYGTTYQGGSSSAGTIYSMDLDGSNLTVIHSFLNTVGGDGAYPVAGIIEYNGKFYGSTYNGGTSSRGVLYSLDPDGSNYSTIHDFLGGGAGADGQYPNVELLSYNSKLYGVATGGTSNYGMMFSIDPDGSNYTVLKNFTTVSTPFTPIIENGGTFYLTAYNLGSNFSGAIFSIQPDGSNMTIMHEFGDTQYDGQHPRGSIALVGSEIWGATTFGGQTGKGTIYSTNLSGSAYTKEHDLEYNYLYTFQAALVPYNDLLYGMSVYGGAYDTGALFTFDPTTKEVNVLHSFSSSEGTISYATVLLYDGAFYGTLSEEGANNMGALFKIDPDGSNFEIIHSFSGGATDGNSAWGNLIEVNGLFYGTTAYGGVNNVGTVFSINPDGTNITVLHSFENAVTDGYRPWGGVTHVNGKLYGTTYLGGANGRGTLYSMDIDGSDYSVMHNFDASGDDGYPQAELLYYEGALYGVSEYGGANGDGSLFSIEPDGTNYQILHDFDSAVLDIPEGNLYPYNGRLYGLTYSSPNTAGGGLYSINPDGSDFTIHHEFLYVEEANGSYFHVSPVYYNRKFYGAATYGGINDDGTLWSYELPDTFPPIIESISPTSGSQLTPSSSTVTLTLDENGSCRASLQDKSYNDMSTAIPCSGTNTTTITCTIPELSKTQQTTIYFACKDQNDYSDTADSNSSASYIWADDPTPPVTTPPAEEDDDDQGEDEDQEVDLIVEQEEESPAITITWNTRFSEYSRCRIEIADLQGNVIYSNSNVSCNKSFTLPEDYLDTFEYGEDYIASIIFYEDDGETIADSDSVSFTYSYISEDNEMDSNSDSNNFDTAPTTDKPTEEVKGINWTTIAIGASSLGFIFFLIVFKRRKEEEEEKATVS